MDELIANHDLRLADIPGHSSRLCDFAHTIDGYATLGGMANLSALAAAIRDRFANTGGLPWSLTELRSVLFYEYRALRFDFDEPDNRLSRYLEALAAEIRSRVESGDLVGLPHSEILTTERESALRRYRAAAGDCIDCRALGLLHRTESGDWSRPLHHAEGTAVSGVLCVFEAPNFADTFEHDKGRMTCSPETDPSGRFTYELLGSVGLNPEDVVFTNSVLCLPRGVDGKFPVRAAQEKTCSHWLASLLDALDPFAVLTFGAAALRATRRVVDHDLELASAAGSPHAWAGRLLLPLYHPSALGRVARSAPQQLADIQVLGTLLNARHA